MLFRSDRERRHATAVLVLEHLRAEGVAPPAPEFPARCAADTLTPKQRKVVETIAAHPSAPGKVLADLLHMSEHTLRNHLTSIYSKLEVENRLELVMYAVKHHITDGA